MSESAKEFLESCSDVAEQTFEEDAINQESIQQYWNFTEIVQIIANAIRDSVVMDSGSKTVDMERYYDILQKHNVFDLGRDKFTQEQIDGIASACFPSYIFAMYVCKGRFPEGEPAMQRSLKYWNEYNYICENFFDKLGVATPNDTVGFRRPL